MNIEEIITLYEYFKDNEDRYDEINRRNDMILSSIISDLKMIKEKLGIDDELPF